MWFLVRCENIRYFIFQKIWPKNMTKLILVWTGFPMSKVKIKYFLMFVHHFKKTTCRISCKPWRNCFLNDYSRLGVWVGQFIAPEIKISIPKLHMTYKQDLVLNASAAQRRNIVVTTCLYLVHQFEQFLGKNHLQEGVNIGKSLKNNFGHDSRFISTGKVKMIYYLSESWQKLCLRFVM